MNAEITFRSSNIQNIKAGQLRAKYSAAGDRILRFYVDFRHEVLNLHKELSAPEIEILQNKVDVLMASWDKKYEMHQKTVEPEKRREHLRHILEHTLDVNDEIDWDILKDRSQFNEERFSDPKPSRPSPMDAPKAPKISFFQKLLGRSRKLQDAYLLRVEEHQKSEEMKERTYEAQLANWQTQKTEWESKQVEKKAKFLAAQERANAKVDALRNRWESGDAEAIIEHASMVLEASEYDETVRKEYNLQYNDIAGTLLVEYLLPSPDDLPTTKSVRFIAETSEMKETELSEKDKRALFEDVCYQVCLRTIHELFEADIHKHIRKIVFNGVTEYIDKATGRGISATILSLMVDRDRFLEINLAQVDAKTCFKSLKGVSAASLAGLSPIAPIMELDKTDKRFIDAKQVCLDDDGSTNLAAMDWEEFEHLVRELFEKEFASRGGEVRVTQSSRDGGVDAVAFDPDPISGGKIVIQAKRYTKTVGVAAVRDLYGTTVNEGASKGILVTTADYGPDAYKFAAGKPLTLMTGANLLHLLAKHGIRAKIDLHKARRELGLT